MATPGHRSPLVSAVLAAAVLALAAGCDAEGGGRRMSAAASEGPPPAQTAPAPSPSATPRPVTGPAAAQRQQAVPAGTTIETLDVDGLTRDVLVYVPASLPAGMPVPLILMLHGWSGNAAAVASAGLNEEAERHGFIAVFPNGGEVSRNAGINQRWWNTNTADEVRFIAQVLDLLAAKYAIDATRTFVAGLSNGGDMSYRLACDLSDRIAAIAVLAGSLPASRCMPGRPVSVLHIHGTSDLVRPYAGATEMIAFWRMHNGCASPPMTSMVTTVIEKQTAGACRDGTEVTLYTIKDGTHSFPGGPHYPLGDAERPLGVRSVIVEFLLAHSRGAGQPPYP